MNLIIIVLSVSVILLLFILFRYFSNNSTKLAKQSTLLTSNAVIAVTSNPSATRYAFGIWIYVKSWNTTIKPIFEFPGKIKLYLDASAPTLNVSINTTVGNPTVVKLTQNFPLQKWTYVTVSVDNSYIDSYIDGKLVKSIKIEGLQSAHTEANVYLGGKTVSPSDIQISNFLRWTNALTPQDVWNEFNKGNGGNWLKSAFSQYGLDLNLKKDSSIAATLNIL